MERLVHLSPTRCPVLPPTYLHPKQPDVTTTLIHSAIANQKTDNDEQPNKQTDHQTDRHSGIPIVSQTEKP